jgi:hypothetical protein
MANTQNLKLVHMMTGEEFIGELVSEDTTTITVKNPVRIVVIPTADQSNPKVAFGPYTQWTDDKTLTLNRHHVTYIAEPITEFVNQYNGMFGGLVLPRSEIIKP